MGNRIFADQPDIQEQSLDRTAARIENQNDEEQLRHCPDQRRIKIADAVEDAPLSRAIWAEVLELFKGNGYQARNAGNAVNRYRSEMARLAAGKRDSPVTQRRPETLRDQMLRRESAK